MTGGPETWFAGFDVGGTRLKSVAMRPDGEILFEHTEPSAGRRFDDMVDVILERGRGFAEALGPPAGIGTATPGIVRLHEGPVTLPGRLEGSEGYPLVARLSEAFGCPVTCLNDGDAAALGESRFGAGRGESRLVVVTLGTGIGGGIVIDGRLLGDPVTGAGSYLGHIVMQQDGEPCLCGNRGCAETLVSANAVVGRVLGALKRELPSSLADAFRSDPDTIDFKQIISAASAGDPLASTVIARFIQELSTYLVSLAHLLNPTAIVLGGGVMHGAPEFLPAVQAKVQRRQFRAPSEAPVAIVRAAALDMAGAQGACVPLIER